MSFSRKKGRSPNTDEFISLRNLWERKVQETKREQGSVIVILATDALLDARQLGRLTRRVPLGLARTGEHGSGDLAIAVPANRIPHDETLLLHHVEVLNEPHPTIDRLFTAVVEVTEEAVINSLCAAYTQSGRDNHRAEALPFDETLAILRRYGRV